jgi:hypothetical protein
VVAETNGDKGSRFSLTLWQALRDYNVVVLQHPVPWLACPGSAVIEGLSGGPGSPLGAF